MGDYTVILINERVFSKWVGFDQSDDVFEKKRLPFQNQIKGFEQMGGI